MQGAGALLPVGRRQSSSRKPHCSPRTDYAAKKLSDGIGVALAPRIADLTLTSWASARQPMEDAKLTD